MTEIDTPHNNPNRAPLPPWWWHQSLRTRQLIALGVLTTVLIASAALLFRLVNNEPLSPTAYLASMSSSRQADFDDLAACESESDWEAATGNGYYGGLQFTTQLWAEANGEGLPNEASRAEQIMRGDMIQKEQGWSPWPDCSKSLGLQD
jgi:hypothetical protein